MILSRDHASSNSFDFVSPPGGESLKYSLQIIIGGVRRGLGVRYSFLVTERVGSNPGAATHSFSGLCDGSL